MHFKCGHHGQALWAESVLYPAQSLQCTFTRLNPAHVLLMFTLNPQFWNIQEMNLYHQGK